MRGYLTAWAQMCWAGGKIISTGVLRSTIHETGDWAWRLPYALQWMWPVPLVSFVLFAPESPWWLVRKGRYEDAKATIRRGTRPGLYNQEEIDGYVEYMKHTDALDRMEKARGSFFDMFKGVNLRRTEVQIGTWVAQIWNGNAITNLSVLFFEKAGISTSMAFDLTLIQQSLGLVGVGTSWIFLRYVGRRKIYIGGLLNVIVCNFIIGVIGFTADSTSSSYALGGLMTWISFAFSASMGPVCYVIVGELPASRLRARSIVLGRFIYVINAIIASSINPYTTNDWGPKSGFFWMGMGSFCFIWCFFRLPETGCFSFAELDILFANKVSARKFTEVSMEQQLAIHEAAHPSVHLHEPDLEKDQVEHSEEPV
jgi:SP family general alpha glucoside:H+ symporter-like MFS transporter